MSTRSTTNSEIIAEQENHPNLMELDAPDVNYQTLCITYIELAANFELKSGLIHLLLKFHGLAGECLHKHLKEFRMVCSMIKPQAIDEVPIKLRG
ncbi:hypothetical protein K1719_035279 [Acacia pycnantha]|nr:hypothetical protein K1719_035279 [Acacia pycnantha]